TGTNHVRNGIAAGTTHADDLDDGPVRVGIEHFKVHHDTTPSHIQYCIQSSIPLLLLLCGRASKEMPATLAPGLKHVHGRVQAHSPIGPAALIHEPLLHPRQQGGEAALLLSDLAAACAL